MPTRLRFKRRLRQLWGRALYCESDREVNRCYRRLERWTVDCVKAEQEVIELRDALLEIANRDDSADVARLIAHNALRRYDHPPAEANETRLKPARI
jgi:hypothetical protein